MDAFELQELKTALLDEIQNAFQDKKSPLLKEYEEPVSYTHLTLPTILRV